MADPGWPITRTSPHPRLSASLSEIGQSNRHADCSFIIETAFGVRRFPCHKLIFSCASEVFDRMLFGDYSEASSGEVRLHDVDPDIFEKFRDYLYGYEYQKLQTYDFDTLMQLCEFGNKYLVVSIEDDCVRELLSRKDTYGMGELLQLFQCAHRINKQTMIEQVGWILRCNFTSPLNHSGVYEFNPDVFKSYIEVIAGKMPEADRFCLVEMYLKHQGIHSKDYRLVEVAENEDLVSVHSTDTERSLELPELPDLQLPASTDTLTKGEEKPNYVADLIGLINFSRFTAKEFHEGPGHSNYLSLAQKYEYMYKIARSSVPEFDLKVGSDTDQTQFSDRRRRRDTPPPPPPPLLSWHQASRLCRRHHRSTRFDLS